MSLGKMFLSAAMAEGSVSTFLSYGPLGHLFKPNEQDMFDFVSGFAKEYGVLPKPGTVEAHTEEEVPTHAEPAAYYLDLLRERHVELTIKTAMKQASDLLKPEAKDASAAAAALTAALMKLAVQQGGATIHDFRDAADILIPEYVQQYTQDTSERLMLGWPTLDNMSGGFVKGDFVSIVGRPKMGKTWDMLYAATYGWLKAQAEYAKTQKDDVLIGSSRLLVSMEMKTLPIEQRLAAMALKVPIGQIKHAELSSLGLQKYKDGLMSLKGFGAPFYVVDGNLASTVADIEALCRQLKPGALFLDGGYLVQHPTEKDRFRRVAENATLIKERLCPLQPTVVSWQFAKPPGGKGKKAEKLTADNIGYTDAIQQLSTTALGIFEEDSVETLNRRVIEILFGRNGEVGRFITNWDFGPNMDFSEVFEEAVEELQFV
jgi:hypothetical protein